jgi:hypothetical protein
MEVNRLRFSGNRITERERESYREKTGQNKDDKLHYL